MTLELDPSRIRTLDQVRAFLRSGEAADFQPIDRVAAYDFVRRALVRFDYDRARRPDKSSVKRYLEKVTGLSRAQVTRLVAQWIRTGRIVDHRRRPVRFDDE